MNFCEKKALIDVIVPAYKAEQYILDTLRSIAIQGDLISKVIVVDDGSNDATASIVNDFIKSNENIDLILLKKRNGGIASARNHGLLKSDSEFIAFVDADDVWLKGKLRKQLNVFLNSSDPNLGVVYSNYEIINEFGEEIDNIGFKLKPDVAGYIYDKLSYGNLIAGSASAVLIKKKYLDLVGTFDVNLICAEDWDMWIRLSKVCTFNFSPDVLVHLRRHPSNIQNNRLKMVRGELLVLNKLFISGDLPFVRLYELKEHFFLLDDHLKNLIEFKVCHPFIKEYFFHKEKLTKEQKDAYDLPVLSCSYLGDLLTIVFNYGKVTSYIKYLLKKNKITNALVKKELFWLLNTFKNPLNLLNRFKNFVTKIKLLIK